MKISDVVKMYLTLRAEKASLDAAKKEVQAKMDKIEAKLLETMQKMGVDSLKTEAGTAYSTTRTSSSVGDKEVFMNFVREKGEWALLESRASKEAVKVYMEENNGELPPGVNWREEVVVNFRQ